MIIKIKNVIGTKPVKDEKLDTKPTTNKTEKN